MNLNTYILLVLLIIFKATFVMSQKVNYNAIILPSNEVDIEIEERLIQLAWANQPLNQQTKEQLNIAEYNKKAAQWSWLDYLSAQGNINEFTLDEDNPRNDFFPRYNFRLTLNLGTIAQTPLNVKRAKSEYRIAELSINEQKLNVRSEVLTRYENYKLYKEILEIRLNEEQESETNLQLVEDRFSRGEDSIEEYNVAVKSLSQARVAVLTAEKDYNLSVINLERLIGINLQDVVSEYEDN